MIAAGNDRHDRIANTEAAALLAHVSLRARWRIEAEGRAAGQHDRVDTFHGLSRIQQGCLARAGPAAAHVHTGGHGRVEYDRGHAGTQLGISRVPHADARNISDQIPRHIASERGPYHVRSRSGESRRLTLASAHVASHLEAP